MVFNFAEEDKLSIAFPFGNFTEEEKEEIINLAQKIIPTKEARRVYLSAPTGESLQAIIVLILGYITSMAATGFFQAIGSNTYNIFKVKISEILSKKERPSIKFEMIHESTKINITSYSNDKEEIKIIFDTIDKAKDLAVKELEKEDSPALTEINIIFDGDWTITGGQYWYPPEKIEYYYYDNVSNKFVLTGPILMKDGKIYRLKDDRS